MIAHGSGEGGTIYIITTLTVDRSTFSHDTFMVVLDMVQEINIQP